MGNMELLHDYTEDGLRLPGVHWYPEERRTCVIFIHGMFDNILENYFAETLGGKLSANGYGFIFAHNRAYGVINDIATRDIDIKDGGFVTKRVGTIFDRFEDCIYDIDMWINEALKAGYSEVILMGHSLGCNKIIYYLSQNNNPNVKGVILASAPDVCGIGQMLRNYGEMADEAKKNVKEGNNKKILSQLLWNTFYISSETFLSYFEGGSKADNLPVIKNPEVFDQFSGIDKPVLAVLGSMENIIINSPDEDLKLLKSKASSCPDFKFAVIEGANHRYMNKDNELSDIILKWVISL
jgi:alpha-beta hydrolase superfamily lysophospholipase